MDIHLTIEDNTATSRKLDLLIALVQSLVAKENKIMLDLTAITAQIARNKDAEESAVQLLTGLKKSLDDAIASNDPTALAALSASLGTNTDALAAAVVANTPAAASA